MYCSRCGSALPAGAAYCGNCGAAVAAPPGAAAPGAPAEAWVPVPGPAPGLAPPVAASLVYAGFWRRFWALCLDSILLNIALFPLAMLLWRPMIPDFSPDEFTTSGYFSILAAYLRLAFFGAVANWLYYALMESSVKQATLGKMALGVQVTDLDGRRIGFGRATGRYLAKILSGLTFLIGYILQVFTSRRQALHDLIAGTLVVRRT